MRRRPSKAKMERAASIVNDIHEDIDNGESRKVLREALSTLAMSQYYEIQALHSHYSGKLLTQLKALNRKLSDGGKG